MSLASHYAFPLTIAAAVMFAAFAITCGVLQIVDPQPWGWGLVAVYSGGSVFWTAAAIWIRHEQRQPEETADA